MIYVCTWWTSACLIYIHVQYIYFRTGAVFSSLLHTSIWESSIECISGCWFVRYNERSHRHVCFMLISSLLFIWGLLHFTIRKKNNFVWQGWIITCEWIAFIFDKLSSLNSQVQTPPSQFSRVKNDMISPSLPYHAEINLCYGDERASSIQKHSK